MAVGGGRKKNECKPADSSMRVRDGSWGCADGGEVRAILTGMTLNIRLRSSRGAAAQVPASATAIVAF